MKATPRTTLIGCLWVGIAGGLLLGCASGPSTLVTLQQARTTLDQARHAESIDARDRIKEAEGALAYAEQEYRLAPGHPLSHVRAETALEKARAAFEAARRAQAQVTAH